MLYLLLLPRLSFFEQSEKPFSLLFVELRGPAAREARSKEPKTALIPELGPTTPGRLRHSNVVGCIFEDCTLVQAFDEDEPLANLLVIGFGEQAVRYRIELSLV